MSRRDDILSRLDAITKGEWWAGGEGVVWAQGFWADGEGRLEIADVTAPSYPLMQVEPLTEMMANAEFIAHAPDDMRWLLAENARLGRQIDDAHKWWRAALDEWQRLQAELHAVRG